MARESTVYPNVAYCLPLPSVPGTEDTLDPSLRSIFDYNPVHDLSFSSTLALGGLWSVAAPPTSWTDFNIHLSALNASNSGITNTQDGVCGQFYPHHSPSPLPSPTVSTGSPSSLCVENFFDDRFLSASPMGYSGFPFPSPAAMGHDTSLPFSLGFSPPVESVAHTTQITPLRTPPSIFSPCGAGSSLLCHPAAPPSVVSPVRASSMHEQGGHSRQESLLIYGSSAAGQSSSAFSGPPGVLYPHTPSYPLPAFLTALPLQESHSLPKRSGATTLIQSVSFPDSLKTNEIAQGPSSIEHTTSVSGGLTHPSLASPVQTVKVKSPSPPLRASTSVSPQTHHTAEPTTPSDAISTLGATSSALNTPPTSDTSEGVVSTRPVQPGMRIRKSGLKRMHECNQCPQSYVRAEHLRRHVKSKHMSLKEHACDACDFRCSRSDNLRQHRRTMHDA